MKPVTKRDDLGLHVYSSLEPLPYPTLPYPTLPYPTLPYPTLPYPTLPYPTLPYPTLPYPTLPYPTLPYPALPSPTLPQKSSNNYCFKRNCLIEMKRILYFKSILYFPLGNPFSRCGPWCRIFLCSLRNVGKAAVRSQTIRSLFKLPLFSASYGLKSYRFFCQFGGLTNSLYAP